MSEGRDQIGIVLSSNGFEVELPDEVDVLVRDFPNGGDVSEERERVKDHWFVHWFGRKLYYLRLKGGGPNVDGDPQRLKTKEHPWLLRARLEDAVGDRFSRYEPIKRRPFTFLALKNELVGAAAKRANIDASELEGITVTPRFELHSKIYEPADGDVRIGIFVSIGMAHDISAALPNLQERGVSLAGRHLVRREREPGQRGHVGRFDHIENEQVVLREASDASRLRADLLKLEGSTENFAHCVGSILNHRTKAFKDALETEESAFRLGPTFDAVVERLGAQLTKEPISLGFGIETKVGKRITFGPAGGEETVRRAPPVDYVFDRSGSKTSSMAWDGLVAHGPYDRVSFPKKSPRLLVAYPRHLQGRVETFLSALKDGLGQKSPAFEAGFPKVFGLIKLDLELCPIELKGVDTSEVEKAYRDAISESLQKNIDVDAAIVVLDEPHAFLPDLQSPYLRCKALLMTLGIPVQSVRSTTLSQQPYGMGYTLRNIAVSLYAKLEGTPWTVAQDRVIADELVIGMGFAELSGSRVSDKQRHVGITTVFSGDGTYVLGNVSRECAYSEYPDVVRSSMLSVLKEVKRTKNWKPGDKIRVVFHAHRPLRRIDVASIVFGCMREVGSEQDIELAFVTVTHDHPFFLIDKNDNGVPIRKGSTTRKGVYAPKRGTIARLGRHTRLLSVNAGFLIKRPETPLPTPLLIKLHEDSTFGDVDYIAEQVLKFTSLSWRSTLPVGTPVTIFYSERIAELLGRLRSIPNWSTTALDVKLKHSRWFL